MTTLDKASLLGAATLGALVTAVALTLTAGAAPSVSLAAPADFTAIGDLCFRPDPCAIQTDAGCQPGITAMLSGLSAVAPPVVPGAPPARTPPASVSSGDTVAVVTGQTVGQVFNALLAKWKAANGF